MYTYYVCMHATHYNEMNVIAINSTSLSSYSVSCEVIFMQQINFKWSQIRAKRRLGAVGGGGGLRGGGGGGGG